MFHPEGGVLHTKKICPTDKLSILKAKPVNRIVFYQQKRFNPALCNHDNDCIGLYKIQNGFPGFVYEIGFEVRNLSSTDTLAQDQ